jgi:hypothetical protein
VAEKLSVADCITDCVRLAVPQPTEWQRIGNQIDAAFNPVLLAKAILIFGLAALLACLFSVRCASLVNPTRALRVE